MSENQHSHIYLMKVSIVNQLTLSQFFDLHCFLDKHKGKYYTQSEVNMLIADDVDAA